MLAMVACGFSPEWSEIDPNPLNASIRFIEHGCDYGYELPVSKILHTPNPPSPDRQFDPTSLDYLDIDTSPNLHSPSRHSPNLQSPNLQSPNLQSPNLQSPNLHSPPQPLSE